jgi:hypothetical protein
MLRVDLQDITSCCIDQRSSAELSEAINAMFRWYKNADVCYVYLSDAEWCIDKEIMNETLGKCRWFTRGWTLQELIAPRNIEFYSRDWQKIATKDECCKQLSLITGIDKNILRGSNLANVSIARRMSWASRRETTRQEDIAYCLLGIFDVNIPLIYGEGLKAFQRLQETIMNTTYDQSLFAWGSLPDPPSDPPSDPPFGLIDREQELGFKPIHWKSLQQRKSLLGLFAEHPRDFQDSSEISPVDHGYTHELSRRRPPTMVNGGPFLDFVIYQTSAAASYWDRPPIALPHQVELAVLLCQVGNTGGKLVGLVLHPWGDGYYSRSKELVLIETFLSSICFQRLTQPRHIMPQRPFQLHNGDVLLRQWTYPKSFKFLGIDRPITKRGPAWRQKWHDKVLRLEEDAVGDEEMSFFFGITRGEGIAITLRRLSGTIKPLGDLLIGTSRFETTSLTLDDGKEIPNWIPKHGKPFQDPEFHHAMKIPSDTWELKVRDLARICVKVNRVPIDDGCDAVDVVDVSMYPDCEDPESADPESLELTSTRSSSLKRETWRSVDSSNAFDYSRMDLPGLVRNTDGYWQRRPYSPYIFSAMGTLRYRLIFESKKDCQRGLMWRGWHKL